AAPCFLVTPELLHRPPYSRREYGVRASTRARFIYIQRARGAKARASLLSSKSKKQPAPMALKWRGGDGGAVHGRAEMGAFKKLATQ
ncbi:hypothetical protein Q6A58_36290, partial [Pseudomonas aeruginosa]|uniref:hypothetical protein n=1 Tax=Pseudomonas aeruginosa TaxID=287 RepID=UPI002712C263